MLKLNSKGTRNKERESYLTVYLSEPMDVL